MAVIVQLRRGNADVWETNNPTLAIGEMGVEIDTGRFKVGDGTTEWNSLAYSSGEDGSTWHDGAGAPAGGLGHDLDYYLNSENGDVYHKSEGSWSVVMNLIGPQGPEGPQGEIGPAGSLTGGTLTGDLDADHHSLLNVLLQGYAEAAVVEGAASGVVTLDVAAGSVHVLTLTGDVTECNLVNPAANGAASSVTVIVHQDITVRSVQWDSAILWRGGEEPALDTAEATTILTFVTVDGGSTWYGMEVGEFVAGN